MAVPSRRRAVAWVVIFVLVLSLGVFGEVSSAKILSRPGVDKLAHMSYMGLLALLMARRWGMWSVIFWGVGVAVGIEIGQAFTPNRSSDVMDAVWGSVGTWIGWGVYQIKFIHNILERKLA